MDSGISGQGLNKGSRIVRHYPLTPLRHRARASRQALADSCKEKGQRIENTRPTSQAKKTNIRIIGRKRKMH
eukprot:293271-Amphidinium_carterae.1